MYTSLAHQAKTIKGKGRPKSPRGLGVALPFPDTAISPRQTRNDTQADNQELNSSPFSSQPSSEVSSPRIERNYSEDNIHTESSTDEIQNTNNSDFSNFSNVENDDNSSSNLHEHNDTNNNENNENQEENYEENQLEEDQSHEDTSYQRQEITRIPGSKYRVTGSRPQGGYTSKQMDGIRTIQRFLSDIIRSKKWRKLLKEYQASEHSRPEQLRLKRLQEIVTTEQSYYNSLSNVKMKYKDPMSEWKSLTQGEVDALFNNWDTILSISEKLLEDLERCFTRWPYVPMDIGGVFFKMAPFFQCYTEFVSNYSSSLEILTKLKKRKHFNKWFKTIAQQDEFHGQDLSTFLIYPVQRLPRYVLLLQDLLKATPPDHVEYKGIAAAIEKLRHSTDAVNTKARLAEQLSRVYEIQSKLIGENIPNLVRPHRRLIRSGDLTMITERPQPYYIMLFNDLILIGTKIFSNSVAVSLNGLMGPTMIGERFSTPVVPDFKVKVNKAISLFNASVQALQDQPPTFVNSFVLASSDTHYFSCESKKEQTEWVRDVRVAIKGLSEGFFNSYTEDMHVLMHKETKSGYLMVKTQKQGWSKRRVVVENGLLQIFSDKNRKARTDALELRTYRLLLLADKEAGRRYCFELKNEKKQSSYWFGADDGEDFDNWVTLLFPLSDHTPTVTTDENGTGENEEFGLLGPRTPKEIDPSIKIQHDLAYGAARVHDEYVKHSMSGRFQDYVLSPRPPSPPTPRGNNPNPNPITTTTTTTTAPDDNSNNEPQQQQQQ